MLLPRIRALRLEHGLTLVQVANSTGLSVAMLSQVERGLTDPSLETLRRLAEVFNLPLFDLLREEQAEQAAVIRHAERRQVSSPRGQIVYTQVSRSGGKLEVLEAIMEPGAVSSSEPRSHVSEECILVLQGKLVVEVDGIEHALDEGDSCYFDSSLPHRFQNPHQSQARFIVSVTPPSS